MCVSVCVDVCVCACVCVCICVHTVCTYLRTCNVVNSRGIQKNSPGAVVDILEHPLDQGKVHTYIHNYVCMYMCSCSAFANFKCCWQVLLGYTSGLMVLWSLATRQVERRYHHNEVNIT